MAWMALTVAAAVAMAVLGGCSDEDRPASEPTTTVRSGDIVVSRAFVGAHGAGTAAGYLHIENSGTADDALVSVSSPDATSVVPMGRMAPDGTSGEDASDALPAPIPAGGSISFAPGGAHLMLEAATAAPKPGTTVTLRLTFRTAAPVDVHARVVDVSDIPDLMEAK